jgi:hypothetical protein
MLLSVMSNKFIYTYLNLRSYINSSTIKTILKTTTYIALFTIVFISSWAVPQEEAYASDNWDCNDAYARAYFYKLDWDYTSTSFSIDQYVATETTTIQRTTTTVDFSSTSNIAGTVKGINALAMSPTGVMYVTITSDGHGTHLFTISTAGVLTPVAHIADYGDVGDLDFYSGVNGYYGFSAGEYIVNENGNDQIYMAQAGFKHGYIYNVETQSVTTFSNPGMVNHINSADFSYIDDWDGYEIATYNALSNKVILYDKDNNSLSEVTPTNDAFSNVSATLASYSYKTPEGEIRFIIDDGLGNRFEVKRTGSNQYNVQLKGATFNSDNSDGASCGPNAYDPFSPTFKTSLGECVNGYQQPSLLITNNKQITQYFDVDYRIAGGAWTELLNGTQITPGGQFTTSSASTLHQGQTIEYRMRYDTSNPSSGSYYTVGDLLTGQDCGGYAAGSVATSVGSCSNGSSTPSVTLTSNGTVNGFFDVQYKIDSGAWITFIDGEEVVAGSPETYSLPSSVTNGSTVYFQYLVSNSNPSATSGFTSADSVSINCAVYSGTITATTNGTCVNDYKVYSVTITNTGNTSMYFAVTRPTSSSIEWQSQGTLIINAGATHTFTANVTNGVIPEFKMVYGVSSQIYRSTDLHSSSNTEGTFTSRENGGSLKSGDSWIRWTASSAVDCSYWGNGGSATNSSNNYNLISQSTSQTCNSSGNATASITLTNYDSPNDAYGGFVDVEYSSNNFTWTSLADGVVLADGATLTISSTQALSSGSTAYFRYRIADTNPNDSTPNAQWGTFSQSINCIASFTIAQGVSACDGAVKYSTLSVTNDESQTLYFRATPSKLSANDTTSGTSNYDTTESIYFSVNAGETLTYDVSTSPEMRKLYNQYGGYLYWRVQGSFSQLASSTTAWSNTTSYPYSYTDTVQNDCEPNITESYDQSACTLEGRDSTFTITNNESATIYVYVNPNDIRTTNSSNNPDDHQYYQDDNDFTAVAIAPGETYTQTKFYPAPPTDFNEYYVKWRYKASFVEPSSWDTLPWRIGTQADNFDVRWTCILNENGSGPYANTDLASNTCVDGNRSLVYELSLQLENIYYEGASGYYPSQSEYQDLWYAFEVSNDGGQTWSNQNLYYNMSARASELINAVPTNNTTLNGWNVLQATNNFIIDDFLSVDGGRYRHMTVGMTVPHGSTHIFRYKVAFHEDELSARDWRDWNPQPITVDCSPSLFSNNYGDAYTSTTDDNGNEIITGTVFNRPLLSIGECQFSVDNGGYKQVEFKFFKNTNELINLFESRDGGVTWVSVSVSSPGSFYEYSTDLLDTQTIFFKIEHFFAGNEEYKKTYYTNQLTADCPTVAVSGFTSSQGACITGGAQISVSTTNSGFASMYLHIQYSTDLGVTWNEGIYDASNNNAIQYNMILPDETKTYTLTDIVSHGTTVIVRYRVAQTSPVTSGAFTNSDSFIVDCVPDLLITDISENDSSPSCSSPRILIGLNRSSQTQTEYVFIKIDVNGEGYSENWYIKQIAVNASNSFSVYSSDFPDQDFATGDVVTVKYKIEKETTNTYNQETISTPITVRCGDISSLFQGSASYVSCSAYGPDKLEFKFARVGLGNLLGNNTMSNTLQIKAEISHDGVTWRPFSASQYSNMNLNWDKNAYSVDQVQYDSYFGRFTPDYYFSPVGSYIAGVMLVDSNHEYKIRYATKNYGERYFSNPPEMGYGGWTVVTVPANTDCNQNDIGNVTVSSSPSVCIENKGKIGVTFRDIVTDHDRPYLEAAVYIEYSLDGGNSWQQTNNKMNFLEDEEIFYIPNSDVSHGQTIQVRYGYIRHHGFISNDGEVYPWNKEEEFSYYGGLTSDGTYYHRAFSNSIFNANFKEHVLVETLSTVVDCDPDSTYDESLTTCECDDLGATSTLSITNNEEYTTFYRVQYSLDGGETWQSATNNLESAFDISVNSGATNSDLQVFVPDGQTIKWRVKDTSSGGDYVGRDWEEVTESSQVDCGCGGGSVTVDVALGTCGNGSSTPVVSLIPSSTDTAYFTIEYKRSSDTTWQIFKTAEIVSNGTSENHPLEVTVPHGATIQVRYKVSKVLNDLSTKEWVTVEEKTINCPFTAVTGVASYSACTNNYKLATFTVTNTSSSTTAAKFNVEYKIVDSSTTIVDWTGSSVMNTTLAPGVSILTSNTIQVQEGQKIIWRYESVESSEDFTGVWTENTSSEYVNCVIDVAVTFAMDACNAGSQLSTLTLENNESLNTVYFQVQYSTDGGVNWTMKNSNLAVEPSATNSSLEVNVAHNKTIIWRYLVSETNNNFVGLEYTTLDASPTVDCPVLDGIGTATLDACNGGQRRSTFTYSNSSSANAPAYFYIQYNLSGDSEEWITKVSGAVMTAGASSTTYVVVPNGNTITWRYYPMSSSTEPTTWINLAESEEVDCALDTVLTHSLDSCIDDQAISRYSLSNNTDSTLYYQVEYFIEGSAGYVVADTDLTLGGVGTQTQSYEFTQSVENGKFIRWRYKAATTLTGLSTASYVDYLQSETVDCTKIDPLVTTSNSICYNNTKEVTFLIKNGPDANTNALFKVQVNIDGSGWVDKQDIILGVNGQFPHSQIVASGSTIQWRYKVAKVGEVLPSQWTEEDIISISCSTAEDITVTLDTNCDANGYKNSQLNINNSGSTSLYYKAEYSIDGGVNWILSANQVLVTAGGSTYLSEAVLDGKTITWRYKISNSGNDFSTLNWTTTSTSDIVNCTGVNISTPYTSIGQCISGSKISKVHYGTLSSSPAPAYYHIQYRIDGGTWTDKVTSSNGVVVGGVNMSTSQSVTSGSSIEWRYKAAYSTAALANISFNELSGGAIAVDCGTFISVVHQMGTCTNQSATSTLTLNNTGSTPLLVTVHSAINSGDWATEVSTVEISAGSQLVLTKSVINGQTISWKYKYAGTVTKLASASETTLGSIPALDCETEVLNQVTINNVLKACVAGNRVSELTITNNSSETVYVEAWYDTGSGWVTKGTTAVINGTPKVLEAPGAPHGATVKWRYRLGLSSSISTDFTTLTALTVDCPQTSSVSTTLAACANQTRDSKLTINNTGTVTQYFKVEYSINNGGYEYFGTVSVPSGQVDNTIYKNLSTGQYITWRYATTTVQNDFSNSSYKYLTRSETVDCTSANLTATQNSTCTPSGTTSVKNSTFTISNGSTNSAQVEIQYSTDNITWSNVGIQTITNSQPYSVNKVMTTNYVIYRYRIYSSTNQNAWQQVVVMAPVDCSTTTTSSVTAYNNNECLNNTPVAKLTIINPNSTAIVVSYDISINGGSWQSVGNTSVVNSFTSSAFSIPQNSTFQWRYKTSAETTYKYVTATTQNCAQVTSINAVPEIVCTNSNNPSAKLQIFNTGSQSVNVMYDYKINNGVYQSGGILSINPNSSVYGSEVPLTTGDQIVYRYKTTSETQYLETPIKSGSDCGSTPNNPVLIQTISECTANSTVSTVEIRNLSNEVKTFYLETNSNGTWALYDTITINPTSSITRTLTVLQNQTVQWRALETSYAQWSLDSPYQVSNIETVNCTPVTTTTVPQPKYIFEPLISTNRVCDFDNGGAEFGITVDNSRSNVAAEVLKKFWINTTQIGEEVIKVPAGQKVDFSSIEVSENSFFNIYLEVTNTENGKVQEMIQSKDADCIEDERPIDREKNPIDKIVDEEDAPVMDEGDTDAMGDNGEDILFLPGDDYVEWVYEEDADDAFEPPIFTPGNTPTLPDTGFNFGRIILVFGAIMAAFGAFILRKSFRY